MISFLVKEVTQILEEKSQYLDDVWNRVDLMVYIAGTMVFILRMYYTQTVGGDKYDDEFEDQLQVVYSTLMSIVCVTVWIRSKEKKT